MNITVIGTGYVGLVTGACFAEFGLKVACVDKDKKKIAQLCRGKIPIYEPGLEEIVRRNMQSGSLRFSTDIDECIQNSLVIFIAVGTPPRSDGAADLSYVDGVATSVAHNLTGYKVIVTKSTVPVGTGERIRARIEGVLNEQDSSRKKTGDRVYISDVPRSARLFDVVSNPEFLREGSAVEDFLHPDRIIFGADSEHAIAIMKDLYSPLYLGGKTRFVITDVRTSELIKYATNAFLATKITFINEIANICDRVGSNVLTIAQALGMDGRISPKFLNPGPGYGGSCFPKDTRALCKIAEDAGYCFEVLEAVVRANERQQKMMCDKIRQAVGRLRGKTIGMLGLSFKPNTDDLRDSPAIGVANLLRRAGAKVQAYDPAAGAAAKGELAGITVCKDVQSAARSADALVIATEWIQFRNLELATLKKAMRGNLLIDLRNIYQKEKVEEAGLRY
ncbi:MAG: UDP-glucose/GDP-mannose dehydrogenase family protein, partial [Acidobacteriota bacterium]